MSTLRILKDLDWADGQTNPSGIKPIAYAIFKRDIVTFPKIKNDGATSAELITYSDDFVLKEGAKWIAIYSTQGKGKLTSEPTGETDCRGFTNKATLSYPDLSENAKAIALQSVNSNLVFVVPHYIAGGGVAYAVLGGEHFNAKTDMKFDTGDSFGSAKGMTTEIEAPDFYPLPNYAGLLETSDGTLNCQTGVFTPAGSTPTPPDSGGEGA